MMNIRKAGVLTVCCLITLLFAFFPTFAFADEGGSVADALKSGKTIGQETPVSGSQPASMPGSETTGLWGYLLQVVFSLAVIAVLIYLLLRFMAKRQLGSTNGPIKVIAAAPLHNGKSLQIVMIGDSLYVLGVGNDVRLLRHIPPGEEVDVVLAEAEMKGVPGLKLDWLPFGRKKGEDDFTVDEHGRTFEELLNKQWGEVSGQPMKSGLWTEEEGQRKGVPR
jgi:flagellar protein FliO/FliZ